MVRKAFLRGEKIHLSFPYDRAVIDSISQLPGYSYDSSNCKHYLEPTPESLTRLVGWSFSVEGDTTSVFESFEKKWLDMTVNNLKSLDGSMKAREYQIDGVKFLKHNKGKGLIADSPGIGKSVQAMLFCKQIDMTNLPAVIVVPASIKEQWRRIWKAWVGTPVEVLYGQTPHEIPDNTSVIINWDLLHFWRRHILEKDFQTFIADECQNISSSSARRTIAAQRVARRIKNFVALSGTPITAKPGQFWVVLNLIAPKVFPSERKFQKEHCVIIYSMGRESEKRGGRSLGKLYKKLAPLMIRREIKDVLKDLPKELPPIKVPIEIDDVEEYEELEKELLNTVDLKILKNQMEELLWSSFSFKRAGCVRWIKDFLTSGEKLVVGCVHHSVMEYLKEHFPDAILFHGKISAKQKEKNKEKFINSDANLMIAQITTLTGVDGFQDVCNNCAVCELPWHPSTIDQFKGRFYRSGQQNMVNMYYLLAAGTVDEMMAEMLDRSTNIFNTLVRGKQTKPEELILNLLRNRI